jgi:hypothetical protein
VEFDRQRLGGTTHTILESPRAAEAADRFEVEVGVASRIVVTEVVPAA